MKSLCLILSIYIGGLCYTKADDDVANCFEAYTNRDIVSFFKLIEKTGREHEIVVWAISAWDTECFTFSKNGDFKISRCDGKSEGVLTKAENKWRLKLFSKIQAKAELDKVENRIALDDDGIYLLVIRGKNGSTVIDVDSDEIREMTRILNISEFRSRKDIE